MTQGFNPHSNAVPKRLLQATRGFLEGTTASTPEEAVKTGQRTLREWCGYLESYNARQSNKPDNVILEKRILVLLKDKELTTHEIITQLGLGIGYLSVKLILVDLVEQQTLKIKVIAGKTGRSSIRYSVRKP